MIIIGIFLNALTFLVEMDDPHTWSSRFSLTRLMQQIRESEEQVFFGNKQIINVLLQLMNKRRFESRNTNTNPDIGMTWILLTKTAFILKLALNQAATTYFSTLRNLALIATIIVLRAIKAAPVAGFSKIPAP